MNKQFRNYRKFYENRYKNHSFSLHYNKKDPYKNYLVQHTLNVIKKLGKLLISTVLDIGCADGFFTNYIAKSKVYAIGIDVNQNEITRAKNKRKECYFCLGDAQYLSFANESFDVVFCKDVLEHVPNDQICCEEIFRVLKVGGIAIISVPTKDMTSITTFFLKLLRYKDSTPLENILTGQSTSEHLHAYSLNSICKLIEKTGLNVIHIDSFGFVFPFYQKVIRHFPSFRKIFDFIGYKNPNLAESTFIISKK